LTTCPAVAARQSTSFQGGGVASHGLGLGQRESEQGGLRFPEVGQLRDQNISNDALPKESPAGRERRPPIPEVCASPRILRVGVRCGRPSCRRSRPWSAVAAATAFHLCFIPQSRQSYSGKGGSCCYRTPRRFAGMKGAHIALRPAEYVWLRPKAALCCPS